MNWIQRLSSAIQYIERNLTENISADEISSHAYASSAHFQHIFHMVIGMTIGEYIRNRRLSLAAQDLLQPDSKIIDVAMRYQYDTQESFSKAFTRFHDIPPSKAQAGCVKLFHPLSIDIYIRGGFGMERKIIPNVPELVYYGSETDYAFSLLASIFNGAGDKTELSELAVYSGMANRFVWISGSWSRGCECLGSIDETPYEDILRLLKTFGWEAKCVKVLRDNQGKPINTDNEQIRNDFVSTIDKGFPIMSLGLINHRFNAVIGYENGGSVIVCKEGIDTPDTPGGEKTSVTVTRDKWEDTITDYILLKEKNDVAPERVRFLDLLKLIVNRSKRTDKIDSKTMRVSSANVGFAAWEAYLYMLEHEDLSELPTEKVADILGQYCDGLCQIWGRNSGLEYYRVVAQRFPEWNPELDIAIDALDKCAKYGGFLWSQGIGWEGAGLEKFRSKDGRKILADEGRKAMANDMVAIEQFEKILAKEGL